MSDEEKFITQLSRRDTIMNYEDVFRDTVNWYSGRSKYASERLISFASQNAGNTILDIGCATGDYIRNLGAQGFQCVGVDINPEYVKKARDAGFDVRAMDAKCLQFSDDSFDTVLLFEVLEHVDRPEEVLKEAKRVSRKNILITVPNCTQFQKLKRVGLTFEHMLERDHVNFFTKSDLEDLLKVQFKQFNVQEREPIFLCSACYPRLIRSSLDCLYKLMLLTPDFYFRLYAVAEAV